ncbi:class II fructose-bisphosphate aldolase [Marinovum sp. 2_MG-2023]|uniref:class II fructose-bisphosphate aldolase n=1 Tax=unclassified Marinovum TaxID=2647166 RepID=UPI0026E21079|nr:MULTISPECIES: class II fructose-bisphosphate aldolase [unclassified Marinovum]MDO6730553.1 class II fructose-bisphosphate aldolase [Marinovum sp. 2_MG-2023]MDO6778703.1 class II fructose-bisphosphate aldolase [Marinovum sp. 1_MG-2023]
MTLVTLAQVLQPALHGGSAVAGLVSLGWEDMCAYVAAAEAEGVPVILQAGPGCRDHTPLPVLGAMFRHLAEGASVPVVAHLDHGYCAEDCRIAIDCGFTSVMFDGSGKPLQQNIDETAAIAEMAHAAAVSCEGEIGFVGYADGADSTGTAPDEAAQFARETGVDAMAISVGNTHLQQKTGAGLDEDRIRAIEAVTDVPLVIHGGSGVPLDQRRHLARTSKICKFNIGTELRMVFGESLRAALANDPAVFDRNAILRATQDPMISATRQVLRAFKPT